MPNPWMSLRCDQLIPVKKAVTERTIGKRAAGGGGKKSIGVHVTRNCANQRIYLHRI
jgi:hypothetical protein